MLRATRLHSWPAAPDQAAGGAGGSGSSAFSAFEFLVLTAARSGEVRLARWEEVDLDAEVWTVPAERMKANREHRVPLSCRAAEVLRTALTARNGSKLVFPSPRGKPLSEMTLSSSAAAD